jgi:hypothetical protein
LRTDKHHLADRRVLLREKVGQFAPHHHGDQAVAVCFRGRHGGDVPAIAKDRDVVGDLEDLVHLVGDVNDRDALVLERADDLEQMGNFALGNGRGRLVHDDQAGIVGNGLGDLDHLRVGDAQIAHHGVGVDVDLQPLQQRFGVGDHLLLVDQPKRPSGSRPRKMFSATVMYGSGDNS